MAHLPFAAQILLVRIVGTNQGTPWNNVFHWQYTGTAPGVPECNSLATSFLTAFANVWAAQMNVSATIDRCDVADLTSDTAASGTHSASTPGAKAGVTLPTSTALVVSWKINRRYRGGHPRSYLSLGVDADVLQGHLWVETFRALIESGANTFLSNMNAISASGITGKLVCLSYKLDKIMRPAPVPFTIQTALVHHRVDTQRPRLGKEPV